MQLFQFIVTAGFSSKAKICFKIVQKFHLRVYFNAFHIQAKCPRKQKSSKHQQPLNPISKDTVFAIKSFSFHQQNYIMQTWYVYELVYCHYRCSV